jgi:hypothetical protein
VSVHGPVHQLYAPTVNTCCSYNASGCDLDVLHETLSIKFDPTQAGRGYYSTRACSGIAALWRSARMIP